MEKIRYSVKDIKQMTGLGNNKVYELANKLPHVKEGKNIYVYRQHWNDYIRDEMERAEQNSGIKEDVVNIQSEFGIKRIN